MQLRTILISTGILAFATSFTSGGPTPAIPAAGSGKRTNVNRDGTVKVEIYPNEIGHVFHASETVELTGYDEKREGRKPGGLHLHRFSEDGEMIPLQVTGSLGVCCYLGDSDSNEVCNPYDFESNQFTGDQTCEYYHLLGRST
jgi:hypothetical protein